MPNRSKRIAAKQAELAGRSRRARERTPIPPQPVATGDHQAPTSAHAAIPRPTPLPGRPAKPVSTTSVLERPRRYAIIELRRIGLITCLLVVLLAVITFILR